MAIAIYPAIALPQAAQTAENVPEADPKSDCPANNESDMPQPEGVDGVLCVF
ncbi:hypothetical protein MGN70_005495 [Eutypa lata]|nr:hypothetical protein MGN70_005495 [Eutypa lata]